LAVPVHQVLDLRSPAERSGHRPVVANWIARSSTRVGPAADRTSRSFTPSRRRRTATRGEHRPIVRIDAVTMNRATLESANFISTTNGELLAAALMGISPMEYSERKLNSVAVLRERLQ
jgi:hypothetical protein